MPINFSGLATGLDTGSIIDQLVAVERLSITRINTQQSAISRQISTLGDLRSKLSALKTKTEALSEGDALRAMKASSSNETSVKVSASSAATAGSYTLSVNRLARAETSRSIAFATNSDGVAGAGTLSLTVGANAQVDVAYDANDSLSDIATKINASDAKVNAAVVFDGSQFRLNITSEETGTANAIAIGDTGGLGFSEAVSAQDAEVVINGTTITRANNLIEDAVTGVSFSLLAPTTSEATVTISQNRDAQKKAVQEMVDAYNAVTFVIKGQFAFSGTQRGTETLFGDSTVQGLQRRLGGVLSSAYANGSATTSAGALGLKLSNDGSLTFDATKFDQALTKDPKLAETLLVGDGATSLGASLKKLADDYSKAATGILASKEKSLQTRNKSLTELIDRKETAATNLETRLRQQFTALEGVISGLQSQSSFLASFTTTTG